MYLARNARSVPIVLPASGAVLALGHELQDVLEHLVLGLGERHAVRDLVEQPALGVHVVHELAHVVERGLVGLDHDGEAGVDRLRGRSR